MDLFKYGYLLLSLLAATQLQAKGDSPAGGTSKLQPPDVLGAKTRILNLSTGSRPVEHAMDISYNDIQRQNVHVDGERATSMLEILRKEASPATWDKSTWQTALRMSDVIQPDDILKMNTGTLKDINVELIEFPREVLPIICRKLSEGSMIRTAMEDIRRLFTFCLKHVSIDGQIIDVTSAVSLKYEHIRDLGSLLCGLSPSQASRLTKEALLENLHHLANCTFDSRTGAALLENAKSKISDLLTTSDNLVMIAGLLHHLSATDIAAIDQVAMADAFLRIARIIEERRAYLSYRQAALPDEQAVEELKKKESGIAHLLMFGIDAVKTPTNSGGRHKRFTTNPMNCHDLRLFGHAIYILSTLELDQITGQDYDECAKMLGLLDHWTAPKLKILAVKAKEAWGYNVSTWNVSNIAAAGSVIAGLPPADIAALDLTDPEALYAISRYNLYSREQTHAAFNNWLTSANVNVSDITGADLLSLGHFLCGASDQQLVEIDHDQYGEESYYVGKIYCFDESQLHALFMHALSFAGYDVTTWPLSVIIVLGSVVAGISPADIGKLSVDQVGAIKPETIRIIPPATFAGLTVEQLQSFSESQALAVTRDQQLQLSVEKMDALEEAGAKNLLDDTDWTIVALLVLPTCVPTAIGIIIFIISNVQKRMDLQIDTEEDALRYKRRMTIQHGSFQTDTPLEFRNKTNVM